MIKKKEKKANNNIQILRKKTISYRNKHTARKTVGWIQFFSCRSILFYVLYVTFSLFIINLIRLLFTSHAIAYSPEAYGQYINYVILSIIMNIIIF